MGGPGVRKWHKDDYQARTLRIARLVDAARKQQWQKLPEMLAYIADPKARRCLQGVVDSADRTTAPDDRKWPVLRKPLEDPSPLVRPMQWPRWSMISLPRPRGAGGGHSRSVSARPHPRGACALAPLPPEQSPTRGSRVTCRAVDEFKTAMKARPDDWAGYANLGTFHMQSRDFAAAVD